MGPRAGLDGCGKSRPSPGFDPWAVQRVAIPTELSRPLQRSTSSSIVKYPNTWNYTSRMMYWCLYVYSFVFETPCGWHLDAEAYRRLTICVHL